MAPADGGPTSPLATFQSETPSWDPSGRWIGITYGTWRRVRRRRALPGHRAGRRHHRRRSGEAGGGAVARSFTTPRPKISRSAGRRTASGSRSIRTRNSPTTSGCGRGSGDVQAHRITMLGRGAEAGWPRWSKDGRWLLFNGASRQTHRTVIYIVEMNQDTGEVVSAAREVPVQGLDIDVFHAEWMDDGSALVAIGKEGPGRARDFHACRGKAGPHASCIGFRLRHDMPGLGASPDGRRRGVCRPGARRILSDLSTRDCRRSTGAGHSRSSRQRPSRPGRPMGSGLPLRCGTTTRSSGGWGTRETLSSERESLQPEREKA